MTWIQTFTGLRFDPFDLDKAEFSTTDVAHALSNICRFVGHTSQFYSVAQHSVLVSEYLEDQGHTRDIQLMGLMHDASEAYLTDIPRPLKMHDSMQFYRDIEDELQGMLYARFGISMETLLCGYKIVEEADAAVLAAEARDLMDDPKDWVLPKPWERKIVPIPPLAAKNLFMGRYLELKGKT